MLICREAELVTKSTDPVSEWLNNAFIIVYFLQVVGLLSHPAVTILWAME